MTAPRIICCRGHAFTPENTIYNTNGSRVCRACKVISEARRRTELANRQTEGVSVDTAALQWANREHLQALYRYGEQHGLPNLSTVECKIRAEELALAGRITAELHKAPSRREWAR